MMETKNVHLQTVELPNIGQITANSKQLTHIFAAIALGRPIEDVRILDRCGRVFWIAYDPIDAFDPELPIILDFGADWLDALRQWADHLEARPFIYSREKMKEWTRRGQEILTWLSRYAKSRLTEEEFQFLVLKIWYDWAGGKWHR